MQRKHMASCYMSLSPWAFTPFQTPIRESISQSFQYLKTHQIPCRVILTNFIDFHFLCSLLCFCTLYDFFFPQFMLLLVWVGVGTKLLLLLLEWKGSMCSVPKTTTFGTENYSKTKTIDGWTTWRQLLEIPDLMKWPEIKEVNYLDGYSDFSFLSHNKILEEIWLGKLKTKLRDIR